MALSLLTQKLSFTDSQAFFDPFPLQQFSTQQHLLHYNDCSNPMEYNNRASSMRPYNLQHQHSQQQHQQQQYSYMQQHHYNHSQSKRSEQMHNIDNNGSQSSNSANAIEHTTPTTAPTNQTTIQATRPFMNGYHHQHIGANFEQVISFVDSPPNSEESWQDDQSKSPPGPQIIDVQTLYPNSASGNSGATRKRRMDWDSLEIDQNDSSASATTATTPGTTPTTINNNNIEIINPKNICGSSSSNDKEKHKREKLSGRASWTDELGFDLNAEYSSNSYLNNETFLSFSQSISALKQEPQAEHLKSSKSPLNSLPIKADKSPAPHGSGNSDDTTTLTLRNSFKTELKSSSAICITPQNSPKGYDANLSNCVEFNTATGKNSSNTPDTAPADADNYTSHNNGISVIQQQLSVLDANKIENASTGGTVGTTTTTPLHTDEHKFQYILAAATSIATKNNEETLTYLNQGQSYEIKLKKIGDLSFYRDKILKSVIKICFHERRLQYMEREQMQQWQASRPGERIIEVDVPLSYGLCHVSQPLNPTQLNTVEVFWDPLKEVGVYIKVNCISTEFTPKKHGGEKGVPFRLQIETYIENTNNTNTNTTGVAVAGAQPSAAATATNTNAGNLTPNSKLPCLPLNGSKQPVHAAACQIKVFKLKGADRKHKQDREKIQKRPQSEQEKFQPSYECTIMNDVALDVNMTASQGCYSPEYLKIWPNSPVHIPKYDGILSYPNHQSPVSAAAAAATTAAVCTSPIAINSVTSTNSPNIKMMDAAAMVSPQHVPADIDDYVFNLMPESTPTQVAQWLTQHRLAAYIPTFSQFSGADVMRMSKEDLMQICGLADGIRMYNILRAKAITPRLTFYVSLDGNSYNAIYLLTNTAKELIQKLHKITGFYEMMAKCSATNGMENGIGGNGLYNAWNMHSKYSGSGSNIFNDVNKSAIYVTGPGGVHITVTDDVLNNEIKDGSLYALDVQNGKVLMKLLSKTDN